MSVTFGIINQDTRKYDECPTCGTQHERHDDVGLPSWLQDPALPMKVQEAERRLDLKEDTARLAELRMEEVALRTQLEGATEREAKAGIGDRLRAQILIAVYEECQARGRLFGGLPRRRPPMDGQMSEDIRIGVLVRTQLQQFEWKHRENGMTVGFCSTWIQGPDGLRRFLADFEPVPQVRS